MFNHNNFTFKRRAASMDFSDVVKLINSDKLNYPGITNWLDMGCGSCMFTRALASLLLSGSIIHAIDTNKTIKKSKNSNYAFAIFSGRNRKKSLPVSK
jgi:hypothetical protein